MLVAWRAWNAASSPSSKDDANDLITDVVTMVRVLPGLVKAGIVRE